MRRLAVGSPDDPRWVRPALWAVLVLAAVLYGWGLSKNGYANEFYAGAVKSGTQSWKAFFFGSLDAKSFITVDKPPMALWVMELSARIFGFTSWSMLVPQVLIGVATVALLYATVRRAFGPVAGVLAALVMTLTPVTVAINRDNNPDTLLVFFLVLAAWACQRAMDSGRLRWLPASAFFVGCGFNTKMLQAWIVLPALTLVYLFLGPGGWGRRILYLLAAGAVLVVSSFWWMTIVDLIPASKRPYIGGSTDGTAWNLIIGYNGIGRITGEGDMPGGGGRMPSGMPRGGGGFGGFGGQSGLGRMFSDSLGGQIGWLLPFAALALVAGVVVYRRRPRTDLARAALILWGGWLIVHFVVFSYANGIFHPYYSTAMTPAVAALAAAGAVELFNASMRSRPWSGVLALGVAATGVWAYVLLRRTPGWNPWLAWTVAALTAVAVLALLAAHLVRMRSEPPDQSAEQSEGTVPGRMRGVGGRAARLIVIAGVAGLVAGLAGPAAYAAATAGHRTNGNIPTAGPSGSGMGFPGGGRMPGGARPPAGMPAMGGRMPDLPSGFPGGGTARGGTGGPPGGQGGVNGNVSSGMLSYLDKHRDGAAWLLAVGNSQQAASLILRSGQPVISMFGFTGSDHAMTVQKLQALVKAGKLHYVLAGGGGGGFGGPGGGSSAVTSWVTKNCTAVKPADYGDSSSSAQSLYRCG